MPLFDSKYAYAYSTVWFDRAARLGPRSTIVIVGPVDVAFFLLGWELTFTVTVMRLQGSCR